MSLDFTIIGGDHDLDITVNAVDGRGQPKQIDDALSVEWALLDKSNNKIVSKALGNGITITGTEQFTVLFESTDHAALDGVYKHAAKITFSNAKPASQILGEARINRKIF